MPSSASSSAHSSARFERTAVRVEIRERERAQAPAKALGDESPHFAQTRPATAEPRQRPLQKGGALGIGHAAALAACAA